MVKNKRFTSDIHRIYDNNEEIACADTIDDAEIIVNKLNELSEENAKLKKENELKGDFRNFINEDIVQIKNENKQLKQSEQEFREYCNYLKSVLEDNEIWYE